MSSKTEVGELLEHFCALIKTQFSSSIKVLRSDNGTEFINKFVNNLCRKLGIVHQTSYVETLQQNGIAERKHRHLLNVGRALMFQSACPLQFWSECVLTAVFLINRTPSSILPGKSPFEIAFGKLPDFSLLKTFGFLCFATCLNNRDKFSPRASKCMFLGYADIRKAYKVLDLESGLVFCSRDVKFYENLFPFKLEQ